MAIYIDRARWPAHGTTFSHVISDRSYEELHHFAARLGLSPRAFDEDHYDVPAELYDKAVAAGALAVTGRELIGVLRGSGLRVPAVERVRRVTPILRQRWAALYPADLDLGDELLARWSEPHRFYHTPVHLHECLTRIDLLAERSAPELLLAAWFHDAIWTGAAGTDEERSADLARRKLGGALGESVARLVLLTRDHGVEPGDDLGAILIDADLGILGAPVSRYERYVTQVRAEYGHVAPEQWRMGRTAVLNSFGERDSIFVTPRARRTWEQNARGNISRELHTLTD